jgi:hypothetical protein
MYKTLAGVLSPLASSSQNGMLVSVSVTTTNILLIG